MNALSQLYGTQEVLSKMIFGYEDGNEGELRIVAINRESGESVATHSVFGLRFRHGIGAVICSEANRIEADRLQVSDHGANRFSVQFFREDVLVSDLSFRRK
jgi:hypothetical protein